MDVKMKLVELIQIGTAGCPSYLAGILADHLIANGVTIPVRCKDCKISFYNPFFTDDGKQLICRKWANWNIVNEDDYCSYGERRTDD